jgi:L-alanine-DL-glutamate epimerase-like enolase superfamily enzyme
MKRRNLLQGLAAMVPASSVLGNYSALAEPLRKKVKITDLKVMVVGRAGGNTLVRIDTDAGVSGYGEAYWGFGVKDIMLGYLRETVIGADPLDIEPLYTKMILRTGGAGAIGGVTITAISGVEIALWDLAGRLLGAPVCKLLGGQYRTGVRVYLTSSPDNLLDPASCREWAAMVKQHPFGFTAVKPYFLRLGDPQDKKYESILPNPYQTNRQLTNRDLDNNAKGFANIREALGEDFGIAVHTHWELDGSDALNLARAVAPMHPMWLEDPLPPDFSEAWVKLTEVSPVPILTGENLYTRRGFMPFIVHQGCNIVQIDIPKSGGLLEAKKIGDLADIFDMAVTSHNATGPLGAVASAHCAAAMRDFKAQELSVGSIDPKSKFSDLPWGRVYGDGTVGWEDYVIHDGPLVKDGRIQIPDKPGLGVEPNPDYVRAHLAPGEQWWG